jgi:putative PEP-CTERM system TPR-repeat lipoprotein
MRPALAILAATCLAACQPASDPAALLQKAAKLQARGELRAAVIELRNAVQADPKLALARRRLAEVYLEQRDGAAAEKELRRAAELAPDPVLQPMIGKALVQQGKYADALKFLLEASSTPEIEAVRGQAHLALSETIAARKAFEAALAIEPHFLHAMVGLGQLAALEGDPAEAWRRAQLAIERHPKAPDAIRFAAALKLDAGKHEEALTLLRQVLALRPGDAHTHLDVAKLLLDAGKFKESQASIDAARRSASGGLHIVYTLALLEFRQNRHAEAKEQLHQILKVAPDYPPALLLSGAIELSLGTRQLAITQLEKFLSTEPNHPHASRLLGAAHLQAGNAQAAAAVVAKALDKYPHDVELLAVAGEAALRMGKYSEAAALFERASIEAPDKPVLRAAVGLSKLGAGDTARAIAELERLPAGAGAVSRSGVVLVLSHLKARRPDAALAVLASLESKGSNPYLLNLKGAALVASNQKAAARAAFEQALKLDPLHLPALDNLCQLDMMLGQADQARQRYRKALADAPGHAALLESAARFETRTGNIAEARRLLETAYRLQPDALPVALRLADFLFRSGEPAKALGMARALQSSHPDNIDVLALLAQMQRQSRQYGAAIESYARLAALSPNRNQVQLLQAAVQIEARQFSDAILTLRKVQSQQAENFDAYALHVAALGAQGKFAEALEVARTVQRLKPRWNAGFQLEGDVHMAARNFRAAAGAYQAGLAIRQEGAMARLLHGALAHDGRQAEADRKMADWLHKHPDDVDSRLYFAGVLTAAGKHAEARTALEAVLRLRPNDPVALNELALAYHRTRDARALAVAMQALVQAPESPEILDTAGWIQFELGKAGAAVALLKRAVQLAPHAATPALHLAEALAKSGDRPGAKRELERIGTANPAAANRSDFKSLRAAL